MIPGQSSLAPNRDSSDLSYRLPNRRVILLGASNLVRGLSTLLNTAAAIWGSPLDVLAAFGHGRSYGLRTTMLCRELPGIAECGLWAALARRPPAPTAALITDIGNDLLLDVPPRQIAAWVEECVERVRAVDARVVLTALPLCSVATLSSWRFVLLRTILFPGCRLRLDTVLGRARDLDDRLRELARRHGLRLVEQQPEWYGFDPIHIRRRHLVSAWRTILSPWSAAPAAMVNGSSLRRWLYLRLLAPERRWLLGREYRTAQPAGALADGTTLAFY
jgi:hypothetical protein